MVHDKMVNEMAGSINFSLVMRGNPTDTAADKRAYAQAQAKEVLDLDAFAEHITSHGCVYSKGDIVGILTMAVSCIRENLLLGNAVQLGELGKFYVSLKSKGAESYDDFVASVNIRKVNVKWSPSDNFKNLINEASFERVMTKKDEAEAKKKAYEA